MGAVRGEGCERYLGYSILELVLRQLRAEGFAADAAYPGQKFPQLEGVVAAVHIENVDRANMTMTLEINILCPAAMGGTECEVQALRATEVLRMAGAVCVQNGCSYDGIAQVYVVPVLATFTGITEAEECRVWPGFYCYINDLLHLFVTSVEVAQETGAGAEYVMGEAAPAAISIGTVGWEIQVEELIPVGSPEIGEPEGEFTVLIQTDRKRETYSGCRWVSIRREFTQKGLRRVRKGIARSRSEEAV